jgi:hypothetical protein
MGDVLATGARTREATVPKSCSSPAQAPLRQSEWPARCSAHHVRQLARQLLPGSLESRYALGRSRAFFYACQGMHPLAPPFPSLSGAVLEKTFLLPTEQGGLRRLPCFAAGGDIGPTALAPPPEGIVMTRVEANRPALTIVASILLLNLHIAAGQATTAIALRTPARIVLGADSKVTTPDHQDGGSRCKIGSVNGVLWIEAGITVIPKVHFALSDVAASAMSANAPVSDRVAKFEDAIQSGLIPIMNRVRVSVPFFFADRLNKAWIQIAFASVEDGVPTLRVRSFVTRASPDRGAYLDIDRTDLPNPAFPETVFATLGHDEVVNAKLAAIAGDRQQWLKAKGEDHAVAELIGDEIAALPQDVGPPISVVDITRDGVNWISRGACAP